MTGVGEDVRFALRQIRRAPGFATSAILTLALGVGANTGIFSLLNGFLRPLPVPDAERLVVLAAELPGDETGFRYRFSYPAFNDYRTQAGVFSDIIGFDTRLSGLTAGGRTTQLVYHRVTGNFFSGLGLAPHLGRFFTPGEGEHAGAEAVIVLGHAYWQKRFGADPNVVGTMVRFDGQPARIIGVAPRGFHGLYQGAEIEAYLTLGSSRWRSAVTGEFFVDRTTRVLTLIGRLEPGVSLATAQSAVDVVAKRLEAEYPATDKGTTVRVIPEPLARPMPLRFFTRVMPLIRFSMLGLAALVLVIACMNVANLLLVRAAARQREIAVRAALGSGRGRLIRLLLVESLILSFAGTAAGLLVARWASDLFLGSINLSIDLPLNFDFDYDWRVFTYAIATAIVTGVLMGLVPALRASGAHVSHLLRDSGHGATGGAGGRRLRSAQVVVQVAGSLVLLVVAGLFVRSLHRAQWIDLGFEPRNVLTLRLDPHQVGYDTVRTATFYEELERRAAALPGVESASLAFSVPMGYIFDGCIVLPEGTLPDPDKPESAIGCNKVTSRYFDTLRLPLAAGRAFTDQDTKDSTQVAIVNETLARRLWPNQQPIGRRVAIARTEGLWQVVGVARDSKYLAAFEGPLPHLYLPMAQDPSFMRVLHLRTTVDPAALAPLVVREIHALDPDIPIADVKTMQETIEGGMGYLLFRVGAVQASAMGGLGLLLAMVGLYGVVSYGAAQRTREIGIRLALGAEPGDISRLVLRQGAALVVAGIIVGLAAAAGVSRAIGNLLVFVSSTDPGTFLLVTLLLAGIALFACYVPARRAMRVDPVRALRHE